MCCGLQCSVTNLFSREMGESVWLGLTRKNLAGASRPGTRLWQPACDMRDFPMGLGLGLNWLQLPCPWQFIEMRKDNADDLYFAGATYKDDPRSCGRSIFSDQRLS